MSTKFTYALVMSVTSAVFSLAMFFLGFQTDRIASGQYFQWFGFVIVIVVLWLGIRAVRAESPGQYFSYGQGVGSGVMISLYAGLMTAVYNFIHFKFINPDFADYVVDLNRAKWIARGMTDAQMEAAESMTRRMMGPGAQLITTPIFLLLLGLVLSLIIAAILKRPDPEEAGV